MTQGKVKAVIFIIIGILIIAIICSWLAGKDNDNKIQATAISNTTNTQNQGTDAAAATPAPGSNAPTIGSSYTSGTNGTNNKNNGSTNTTANTNANTNNSNTTTNTNTNANTNTTTTTTTGDTQSGNTAAATPAPTPTPEPTPEPTPDTTGTTSPVEATPEVEFVARKLTSTSFESTRGMLNLRADVSVETYSEKEVLVIVDLSLDSYSLYLYSNPEGAGVAVNGVFTKIATPDVNVPNNTRTTTSLGRAAFAIELTDGNTLTIPVAIEYYFNGTYAGEQIDKIECGGSVTINRN